jgi:hypothetical protein
VANSSAIATYGGAAAVLIGVAIFLMNSSGSGSGDALTGSGVPAALAAGSSNPKLVQLAQAIATAEGSPASANNPGDLALGDQGNGVFNSAGVTIFATLEQGVAALFHQLGLIFSGQSNVYSTSMTFAQLAQTYTGGDNASSWAATVAGALGVTPDTTLEDWYNS